MALRPINIKVSEDTDFYITAEDDAHIYSRIIPSGIISGVGNECNITTSGNDFIIASGLICIQGYLLRVLENHRVRKLNANRQYLKAKITLGETEDLWTIYVSENNRIADSDLFKGAKSKEILIGTFENNNVRKENLIEGLPETMEELKINLPLMRTAIQNENIRIQKESERQSAESSRIQKESERQSAESSRIQKESERQSAESSRIQKESERQNAELSRVSRETERQSAETQRETWFENAQRILDGNPVGNLANELSTFKTETNRKFNSEVVESVTFDSSKNAIVVRKNKTNSNITLPRGFSGNYNDLTNKPTNLATTTITNNLQRDLTGLSNKVGDTSRLRTNAKGNLVDAINEVFQIGTSKANVIKSKVSALAGRTMSNLSDVATELEKYDVVDSLQLKKSVEITDFNELGGKLIQTKYNKDVYEINKDFREGQSDKNQINFSNTNNINKNVPLLYLEADLTSIYGWIADIFSKKRKQINLEIKNNTNNPWFGGSSYIRVITFLQGSSFDYIAYDKGNSYIYLRNLSNEKEIQLGYNNKIKCSNFNYILVCDNYYRNIKLYNFKTGELIKTLDSNNFDIYANYVFLKETSRVLKLYNNEIKIIDCISNQVIRTFNCPANSKIFKFMEDNKISNPFIGDLIFTSTDERNRLKYWKFDFEKLTLTEKVIQDDINEKRKIINVTTDESIILTEDYLKKAILENSKVFKKVR